MGVGYFQPKQRIKIENKKFVLNRQIAPSVWQIENENTGEYISYKYDELLSLYCAGDLEFVVTDRFRQAKEEIDPDEQSETKKKKYRKQQICQKPLDLLSKKDREKAKERFAYVNAVRRSSIQKMTKKTLDPIIKKVWIKLKRKGSKPYFTTVWRWHQRLIDSGNDITCLVTQNHRKGNIKPRFDDIFYSLIDEAITAKYLNRQQHTVEYTRLYAVELVRKYNLNVPKELQLPLPKTCFVKAQISYISKYDIAVARKGQEFARREYRTVLGSFTANKPLELVEIDHTPLDLFVVDDEHYTPIGRPTVTAAIDVCTRCIVGVHIGFAPPSYVSVANCLKHAILPKNYIAEDYPDIKGKWDCHGAMETLVVDNGMEFHSDSLEALCYPFGTSIHYTPRKKPWFKGKIERVLGTMNREAAHVLPGTTFSNILDKGDYEAAKKATITMSFFLKVFHIWLIEFYHNRTHRIIHQKPIDAWREQIGSISIPLPGGINQIDALLGILCKDKRVTREGVQRDYLLYNSTQLSKLRDDYDKNIKTDIRYNPENLGFIYVYDPRTNKSFKVPAVNQEYANGLSAYMHKLCKQKLKKESKRVDIENLAQAQEKIYSLSQEALKAKGIATRKRAYRAIKGSSSKQKASANITPKKSPQTVTPRDAQKNRPTQIIPTNTGKGRDLGVL